MDPSVLNSVLLSGTESAQIELQRSPHLLPSFLAGSGFTKYVVAPVCNLSELEPVLNVEEGTPASTLVRAVRQ